MSQAAEPNVEEKKQEELSWKEKQKHSMYQLKFQQEANINKSQRKLD